jgi:SAM-dependent methyltransferase
VNVDSATPRGHPVFAAVYGRMARSLESGPIGAARRALLADAHGVVVDLGAGIGLNLPHLPAAVTAVHLVEPDPYMVRRIRSNLPAHAVVHQVGAEHLPLPDGSVDTVLATLTLCTVDDLAGVATEIRRVLRPGGQVLVLEHVRSSERRIAGWQDRLHRPWRWFVGGCNPNRDTPAALAAAGFDVTGLTRFSVPGMPLTREWVTGRLSSRPS